MQYYHINEREGRQLKLAKASLGEFCYHVLKCGGEVVQLWPLNPRYHGSSVYPVIKLDPEKKDELEQLTGCRFIDPPKIKLA